jgi:hypothetical protein
MSLDDLHEDIRAEYGALDDDLTVELDRETRNELAMLTAVLDADRDELVRRAVHALFRTTVDTGDMDFHLRSRYDLTYDEYLYGDLKDTYDQRAPSAGDPDDRRYQF